MHSISLDSIKNSIVLVRVGFDVPNLTDLERILDAKNTIDQLLFNNNKVVLLTKWGKIKTQEDREKFSLKKIVEITEDTLVNKVKFIDQADFVSFGGNQSFEWDEIETKLVLCENVHFWPAEKSKDSSERLKQAQKYMDLFHANFFVDECFISSHRREATNTELKSILPYALGISYSKEILELDKIKINPSHPFVAVMGGAKLETKLPLIKAMLKKADYILLGGMLCFTFLEAARLNSITNEMQNDIPENDLDYNAAVEKANHVLVNVQDSQIESDFIEEAKSLLTQFPDKIVIPVDLIFEKESDKTFGRDLGKNTITKYQEILSKAKTIFWNGPLGYVEKPPFDKATKEIGEYIANLTDCYKVIGGGDTGAVFSPEEMEKFDFVSMGGGASLDYLSRGIDKIYKSKLI
jgi:phosphoglycerate kinase